MISFAVVLAMFGVFSIQIQIFWQPRFSDKLAYYAFLNNQSIDI